MDQPTYYALVGQAVQEQIKRNPVAQDKTLTVVRVCAITNVADLGGPFIVVAEWKGAGKPPHRCKEEIYRRAIESLVEAQTEVRVKLVCPPRRNVIRATVPPPAIATPAPGAPPAPAPSEKPKKTG